MNVIKTSYKLNALYEEFFHDTVLFPEDSDETMTFAAGNVANNFGAWAEIKDNLNVTFSSKLAAAGGHISFFNLEVVSAADKVYVFEIAYGGAKVTVAFGRTIVAALNVGFSQVAQIRSTIIPAGETVYYRMKCETADATLEAHMRYHLLHG